jgi:hypothetical protein
MGENFEDYLVQIESIHKEYLGQIRHWSNLKLATEENQIWIKNFTELQLKSNLLHSIPFIKIYHVKDNLLFPKGSLLPLKKMPNLLWSPIERILSVELSDYNHNFFGVNQSLDIKLKNSDEEQRATALFVKTAKATDYIRNASSIRLKPLKWIIIDDEYALIFGEPMLPIDGETFWQSGNFIFPLGFDLEFPLLARSIEKKLTIGSELFIWWKTKESYCFIEKNSLKPLSIGSWKQTLKLG